MSQATPGEDWRPRALEALRTLQSELEPVATVDPERMTALRHEIERIHAEIDSVGGPAETSPHQLKEELEELALRFEISHPTLTEGFNRVTNLLASMGI